MSNPGLVTKEDLSRLECRLEELMELMDEIEGRVFCSEGQSIEGGPEAEGEIEHPKGGRP